MEWSKHFRGHSGRLDRPWKPWYLALAASKRGGESVLLVRWPKLFPFLSNYVYFLQNGRTQKYFTKGIFKNLCLDVTASMGYATGAMFVRHSFSVEAQKVRSFSTFSFLFEYWSSLVKSLKKIPLKRFLSTLFYRIESFTSPSKLSKDGLNCFFKTANFVAADCSTNDQWHSQRVHREPGRSRLDGPRYQAEGQVQSSTNHRYDRLVLSKFHYIIQ